MIDTLSLLAGSNAQSTQGNCPDIVTKVESTTLQASITMCYWLPQAQLQLSLVGTGSITMYHYIMGFHYNCYELPQDQSQCVITCHWLNHNLLLDARIDHALVCVGKPALFGLSDPSFGQNHFLPLVANDIHKYSHITTIYPLLDHIIYIY